MIMADIRFHMALQAEFPDPPLSPFNDIFVGLAEVAQYIRIIASEIGLPTACEKATLEVLLDTILTIELDGTDSAISCDDIWLSREAGMVRGTNAQFTVGASQCANIHDARAALLRQRILGRDIQAKAVMSNRERIISRATLAAESRYGDISALFATGEEGKATRLGNSCAAAIWHIVADRLHMLHEIAKPIPPPHPIVEPRP